ncbi:MAG TPA: chemotaxis protein CheW [Terriglobales bacterium]|nr:chemotaxis protein CheW [Terriglobales bacterium]
MQAVAKPGDKRIPEGGSYIGPLLSVSERKRILHERARLLARPIEQTDATEDETEVVLFALGEHSYAIECGHVIESFSMRELTPLACAPRYVLGIVNFRGQIVPVVGLDRVLGLTVPAAPRDQLLVLDSPYGPVGFRIDTILGVEYAPNQSERRRFTNGDGSHYADGATYNGVTVLDVQTIIESTRLAPPAEVIEETADLELE